MTYSRFLAMITTSTIVMFGLTYLNSDAFSHVLFSETRAYMAIGMGAVMAVIMLLFMRKMYQNRRLNLAIVAASILVFAVSLFLVRSQATVQDLSWFAGDDSAPFHCHPDQRAGRHIRPPRAPTGGRDHQGAAAGNRRDESPDRRSKGRTRRDSRDRRAITGLTFQRLEMPARVLS